jgi:hypothetical protein
MNEINGKKIFWSRQVFKARSALGKALHLSHVRRASKTTGNEQSRNNDAFLGYLFFSKI